MSAETPDRWGNVLQASAVAHGDRTAVTGRVRDAFSEAGAFITDVHFFSGVQTVFSLEVAPDCVHALEEALVGAGLVFNELSRAAFRRARSATGLVQGTLAVTFAEGDPNLTHEVPSVPG